MVTTPAQCLADGDLVAFPTETVYGLGADGLNPKAVARIFAVKGRPADHPLILHVGSVAAAKQLAADWPAAAEHLSAAFWPGPLTLILKRAAHVPDAVTGGQDTVGVRIPAHPIAQKLLSDFAAIGSGVIAAPSANRFGGVSPTRAKDVMASLGDRLGPKDLVLDGGDAEVGLESTILDCTGERPQILRPGGIRRQAIAQVLAQHGIALASANPAEHLGGKPAPRVSGTLASHYAPRARLQVLPATAITQAIAAELSRKPDIRMAALMFDAVDFPNTLVRRASENPQHYAHDLYAHLNDFDAQGVDLIFLQTPPDGDQWEAVHDRLKRASYGSARSPS